MGMRYLVFFFLVCRHLRVRHNEMFIEYQKVISGAGASPSQSTMLTFVSTRPQELYSTNNPRQRALTSSLVNNLINNCGLPISIVDNNSFRSFLSDFDSKYTPPCRQTVTYSILPQLVASKKERVKALLDRCIDVSLTTDIWTDRRAHAFLAVTAHAFIEGKPARVLISFMAFAGSHTGDRISEALIDAVEAFDLQNKVRCIVTDNASNMRKAIDVMFSMGDDVSTSADDSIDDQTTIDDPSLWLDTDVDMQSVLGENREHLSCFAHSLQLVVRDGLAVVSSGRPFISKCCKIANILHQSALFQSQFEAVMG